MLNQVLLRVSEEEKEGRASTKQGHSARFRGTVRYDDGWWWLQKLGVRVSEWNDQRLNGSSQPVWSNFHPELEGKKLWILTCPYDASTKDGEVQNKMNTARPMNPRLEECRIESGKAPLSSGVPLLLLFLVASSRGALPRLLLLLFLFLFLFLFFTFVLTYCCCYHVFSAAAAAASAFFSAFWSSFSSLLIHRRQIYRKRGKMHHTFV